MRTWWLLVAFSCKGNCWLFITYMRAEYHTSTIWTDAGMCLWLSVEVQLLWAQSDCYSTYMYKKYCGDLKHIVQSSLPYGIKLQCLCNSIQFLKMIMTLLAVSSLFKYAEFRIYGIWSYITHSVVASLSAFSLATKIGFSISCSHGDQAAVICKFQRPWLIDLTIAIFIVIWHLFIWFNYSAQSLNCSQHAQKQWWCIFADHSCLKYLLKNLTLRKAVVKTVFGKPSIPWFK